jgi:hypothetical protein
MANSRRRKSPEVRLRGFKAQFRKTSKEGIFYQAGVRPHHAKFFTFDSRRYKDNVVLRPGFTRTKVLAAIGGDPLHKSDPDKPHAPKARNVDQKLERDAKKAERQGRFDPKNIKEGRERIIREITLRRGQLGFRNKLLEAYNCRCALTNCDCADTLEAAHILPYRGEDTNHIQNGILLRSDIHTLFDMGKIEFAPITHDVILSGALKGTAYGKLKGKKLRLPSQANNRPNEHALRQHLKWSGLKSRQAS